MAVVVAASILVLLGATYYVTAEPAPEVTIVWRQGVTPEQRDWVERRFGLMRPRDGEGFAVTYDLVDLHPANIQDLVERPEVERSGEVDPASYALPAALPYGEGRRWLAHRVPELRLYPVVPALAAACGLMIGYAGVRALVARRRRLARLWAFLVGGRRPRFKRTGAPGPSRPPGAVRSVE